SGKPDLVTLTSNARRVGEIAVAYSPDGSKILFFRTGPDGDTDVPVDLYVIDADGGAPVRLNPPGVGAAWNDTPFLGSASWSPDGRRVAFVGTTGFDIHGDRGWAVYVVGADGSNPKMITPPASTFDAVWSPDGEWIAFDMPNEGSRDLFVVHPDGTGLRAVTSAATDGLFSFGPKWSPDGSWLLFIRGPSEFDDVDLWMSDVEGTNLVQLTHRPAFYSFYSWNT
ncbi:MAG TPA: hypothetical protein VNN79_07770, partial [Actinomycetota bacterium]|nr:hypothetical protein [Actinomycetota bacterium]